MLECPEPAGPTPSIAGNPCISEEGEKPPMMRREEKYHSSMTSNIVKEEGMRNSSSVSRT